ncbi:MAG: carboxypeptidase-like regulatory domain-containing protein [Acidobacteria bacterium]|nr:carboxypeptidase-like regulatory domain-containing protein [Acidobacteriota bacterium]
MVSGEGTEPDIAPVTDDDGAFGLDGLPPGEWLLRALGPAGEVGNATVQVFDTAVNDVTIEVGGLPRAPRRGGGARPQHRTERGMRGSVRGRVVRMDNGEPVADATITVVRGAGPAPDIAPLTNDAGVFNLDGLPAGEWVLRAIGPDGETGDATAQVSVGSVANIIVRIGAMSD